MIKREAPQVMMRWRRGKHMNEPMMLEHAMLEEDTETGEKWYVWEPFPVVPFDTV